MRCLNTTWNAPRPKTALKACRCCQSQLAMRGRLGRSSRNSAKQCGLWCETRLNSLPRILSRCLHPLSFWWNFRPQQKGRGRISSGRHVAGVFESLKRGNTTTMIKRLLDWCENRGWYDQPHDAPLASYQGTGLITSARCSSPPQSRAGQNKF